MKKKVNYKQAREELREWLVEWTGGCDIQGEGYPCGTCFIHLLDRIGLKPSDKGYHDHNKPVDRSNEVWRAILQIREAKIK